MSQILRRGRQLAAREVKNFVSLPPTPGIGRFTLHGVVVGVTTLMFLAFVFAPILALPGLTGVFMATAGRTMPPLRRLRVLLCFGAAYVLCVSIGVAITGNVWLMTICMALIGCIGSIIYQTLITFPPGAMQFVVACAIASYLPSRGVNGTKLIIAGACGFALAMTLSLALQMLTRNKAMLTDLKAAQDAVEKLGEEGISHLEASRRRIAAHAAIFTAWEDVRLGYGSGRGLRPWTKFGRRMKDEVADVHSRFIQTLVRRRWIQLGYDPENPDTRPPELSKLSPHLGPPSPLRLIKWSLSFRSMPVLVGFRMGVAIATTGTITYGLGFGHPYWALMTAAMVLSVGTDRIATTHRGFDRILGTFVGIGLFGCIHALHPSEMVLLGVCVVLYSLTLFTISRNYALGSVWITTLILLVLSTVHSQYTIPQIMMQRAGETLVGAIVSVVVLWLTGWRAPIAIVRRQARRTLLADGFLLDYLAKRTDLTGPGLIARRQVLLELRSARRLEALYARDLPEDLDEWEELSARINEFSYVVMCGCWVENAPLIIDAPHARRSLNDMIRRLPDIDGTPLDIEAVSTMMDVVLADSEPAKPAKAS